MESETDISIRMAEIESETKKFEAKEGVRKIIYGTCIVGIAAASFPFLQKSAELFFEARIQDARLVSEQTRDRWGLLEQLGREGRSEHIETRIRLAEFYSNLEPDEKYRELWCSFLQTLYSERNTQIDRMTFLRYECPDFMENAQNDINDELARRCIRTAIEVDEFENYLNPISRSESEQRASCNLSSGSFPTGEVEIADDILLGVNYCETPNHSNQEIDPKFIVIGYTASGSLGATASWYMSPDARSSSHIIIDRNGNAIQLGRLTSHLWHGGRFSWRGLGLNQNGISIELVNWGRLNLSNGRYLCVFG
jgi:hypothetical protein